MITDDKIATATIAQIFGSELFSAQQSARTDSGSVPQMVTMDPKQFLVPNNQQRKPSQMDQQRMIAALQREAEAACPLPEPQQPQANFSTVPNQSQVSTEQLLATEKQISVKQETDTFSNSVLEKIVIQLTRIANCLETTSNKNED